MNEQEAINELKENIRLSMKLRKSSGIEGKSPSVIAMEMAIKALEKQIPKNPAYQGEHEKCPVCGSFYIEDYCAMCGQRIDRD